MLVGFAVRKECEDSDIWQRKPHGYYCVVCGEYKANEKFSGRGHAAHICKACTKLPPEERAERRKLDRLLNTPRERLSEEDRKWLDGRYPKESTELTSEDLKPIFGPSGERSEGEWAWDDFDFWEELPDEDALDRDNDELPF